jgi:alkylation response protein AidB-like acyl-CoA dehydrogenase
MTRDELLGRALNLVPVLRERSDACEAARCCPVKTVEDFRRAGLLRICRPARYGGLELGWDVLAEIVQTLARGCASQAWIALVLNDHCQLLGSFPIAAQDDVWAENPDAYLSASLAPVGTARRAPGGVIFTGRHGFSSGIDHAQWVICGGRIEGSENGSYFLVPKRNVTVIDDWKVMGLAGTGSKSFDLVDVFVPDHRILDIKAAADEGTGPGAMIHKGAVYRAPRSAVAASVFAAVTIGIAESFLDEFRRYTRPRKSRGASVAELMTTQAALGRAVSEIEAASRLNIETVRETMAVLQRGTPLTEAHKIRARCNATIAAQLALGPVSQLFNMAGGRTIYQSSRLQRLMRDLLGAASHWSLDWNLAAANYGRELLSTALP